MKKVITSLLAGSFIFSTALFAESKKVDKVSKSAATHKAALHSKEYLKHHEFPTKDEIKQHTILDVETIIQIYSQAKNGSAEAQVNLATGYITGSIGNLPNYEKAVPLLEASAKQNNGLAYFTLSRLYYWGLGVKEDKNKSIEYAKKGIPLMLELIHKEPEKHNLHYWRLGQIYFWGIPDLVEQNFDLAFSYFNHAAQLGDFHSMMSVIFMYMNGIGVKKNEKKAFEWSKYLASLNFPVAIYKTGVDYLKGHGVEKNNSKGIEYLNRAAELNYLPAVTALEGLAKSGYSTDFHNVDKSWLSSFGRLQKKGAISSFEMPVFHGGF